MPVAPSFSDLVTQGQAEADARRPDLTFLAGDITLAQIHGAAAMADAVIRFAAQSFKATFIDGATGDELTALVDDHLNIQRTLATPSQVTVEFVRPSNGGTEPAGTILAGTLVATQFDANGDQIQFELDANIVWALGELGPKSGNATATISGRDGNAKASTVTRVIDVPTFDPTFTVTNPATGGGGNDEETDEELRTKARQFFTTLRRGTLVALEFGALLVPSVRVAKAVEDSATGLVTLRVTDSDGNSTSQMVTDVATELENWRCAGTIVSVLGGSQLLVDMTISLTVRVGFDVAPQATLIATAVATRILKLKVGETLFLDSLIGAIIAVYPDDILDVTFDAITTTPGGAQAIADLVAGNSEVIRAGTITVLGA